MQHNDNKEVTRHIARYLAILVVAALVLAAVMMRRQQRRAQAAWLDFDSGTFVTMGTLGRIQLRCNDLAEGQLAFEAARAALEEVVAAMNGYDPCSEISTVNQAGAGAATKVSTSTLEVLQEALTYGERTGGAFDVTVGPLLRLWKEAGVAERLPEAVEVASARARVGYEGVILDAQAGTVTLQRPGMHVDLGAIAKGYGVDRALAALRRPGIHAALVDVGGEIACFGEDRPGRPWRVGVQDPFDADTDNPLAAKVRWVVHLTAGAVATSGNYRRYVEIEGKRYSHIVDPRTGMPAEKLPSVTIIAPTSMTADALATSVSVLGMDEGMALVESLAGTEALLVGGAQEAPVVRRSSGFAAYESK